MVSPYRVFVALPLLTLVEAYHTLSNASLTALPRPGNDFNIHDGAILSPLLQLRVPGTPGSETVRKHLTNFFTSTLPDWTVELQSSSSKIPISGEQKIPFVNVIAYRDPPGIKPTDVGRLTLVAHYDSKKEPAGFIGAIDSAAPCAMIMHAVRSIDAALTRKWNETHTDNPRGIQVIFTDGEENFGSNLVAGDGLYGARSLAAHWGADTYPSGSKYESRLDAIELFVLLDLLGSKSPRISSFYPLTHSDYQQLADLESRLRELGQFQSSKDSAQSWFVDSASDARNLTERSIIDDHIPFEALGVEVLHIIDTDPSTRGFPEVWHTLDDDGEHLDMKTVEDWSVLVTAFAAEWMELEGYLGK